MGEGTRTRLLSPRRRDNSRAGFRRWPFMSVHTWGEDPKGWWQLEIYDKVPSPSSLAPLAHLPLCLEDSQSGSDFGSVANITLITYGTTEKPAHYGEGRQYNYLYNEVQDRDVGDHELSHEEPSDQVCPSLPSGNKGTGLWALQRKRALEAEALSVGSDVYHSLLGQAPVDKREADHHINMSGNACPPFSLAP